MRTRQMRTRMTEFRAAEADGEKRIEGYFAVFGSNYELWPGATESVDPGAFTRTLSGGDVRALTNHDTTLVLGRIKAGTLKLAVDSRGLWGSVLINPEDADAMNLYARVQRGDVDQCSFGFDVREEKLDIREDGTVHWTLLDVELYEVSVCTFPAYDETSASARKKERDGALSRRAAARKERLLRRLKKC